MFEKLVRPPTYHSIQHPYLNSRKTELDQNHPGLTTWPETNPRSREPDLDRGAEVDYIQTETSYHQCLLFLLSATFGRRIENL